MRLTPKGYPRDERSASLIDAPFADAPSTGGICVPYAGIRPRPRRPCGEWGCRDSMRVAKRRERAGKEWSRRERLAVCRPNYHGVGYVLLRQNVLRHMCMYRHYPTDAYVEHAWSTELSVDVLLAIARSTGQGLAADLILATRPCNHVEFCGACCDALRAVLRCPKAADLEAMAARSAA